MSAQSEMMMKARIDALEAKVLRMQSQLEAMGAQAPRPTRKSKPLNITIVDEKPYRERA